LKGILLSLRIGTPFTKVSRSGEEISVSDAFRAEIDAKVQKFIEINNLILETDYYQNECRAGSP